MPRTRKHKYKRKICNSRRSIAMNKRKMKTKTKTKTKPRSRRGGTRKIFKKSHKRYTKNGMKRRIQRGGSKNDHYLKLMALLYDDPYHQWSNSYMAVSGISDHNKFLEVLSKRRLFGLEAGNLSLEELVCSDDDISKKLMTDFRFINKINEMKAEGITVVFEKWKDFINSIRTTISNEEQRKNSLDKEDYNMLKTKKELYCGKATTEEVGWLKDEYALICVELATFLTKNEGKFTSDTGHRVVDIDPKAQYGTKPSAIPRIEVEPLKLDTREFVPILKKYLDFRLSDDRKGSRPGYSHDKIRYFNQKMREINQELQRTSDKPPGNHLYTLLTQKDLIPVYFEKGDSRDDSVSDTNCLRSVRGGPFNQSLFSSGKHHCRTCGRCMNKDDTQTYNIDPENKNMFLNPVCIDCYNLFS